EIRKRFLPNAIVLLKTEDNKERLARIAPFTKDLQVKKDETTAYVCRNYACGLPTNDVAKMVELLTE
ncbi:MAG: hypothetical protein AAFP70_00060, partial [Calditrichota bacterium]